MAPKIGFRHSEKTKAKISASLKGRANGFGCGDRHSERTRAKMSVAHQGVSLSDEHRARIIEGARRHAALDLPDCGCAFHRYRRKRRASQLSQRMADVFLTEFPEVELEKVFGRCRVDAYLPPPYHLAFEADGSYWHSLPGRSEFDVERDAYLLEQFDLPVVRLTEEEICGG